MLQIAIKSERGKKQYGTKKVSCLKRRRSSIDARTHTHTHTHVSSVIKSAKMREKYLITVSLANNNE